MCATCCMPIKRRQHEFVFEFELKLKTKWKLKFVQRVDCLTLSRKFNWVVAAAARLSLSCRFSNLPHSKLAGWRSSAEAKLQQVKAAVNSINRAIWRKQAAYKQQKLFRISAGKCKGRTVTGAAGAASGAGASNWFSAGLQFGCRRTGNYSESVLKCKRMCLARSSVYVLCVCAACVCAACVCTVCVCHVYYACQQATATWHVIWLQKLLPLPVTARCCNCSALQQQQQGVRYKIRVRSAPLGLLLQLGLVFCLFCKSTVEPEIYFEILNTSCVLHAI